MPPKEETKVKDATVKVSAVPLVTSNNASQYKMVNKKLDKGFLWMALITALSFISLASYLVYMSNIAPFIFAGTAPKSSAVKSMVFAYPLTIKKAVGESEVKVFLVSENGNPIPNKVVAINASFGTISPMTSSTDETGAAQFKFTSSTEGVAELIPFADNQKIAQSVTIKITE